MTYPLFEKRLSWAILILFVLLFFISSLFNHLFAQSRLQQMRGLVTDKVSQAPLPGAVIKVLNLNPIVGTTSNEKGEFTLKNLPVGKVSLQVTYTGYKSQTLQNLQVNAGKELVLTITLEEDLLAMKEVVVSANKEKNRPINSMSILSTRTFSVEETQKFAAAVNDPARMATSFAGVVQGEDGNNVISIRGNSPNGLLWRMEGVDIPNPNHFSSVGSSGGGISILSSQLLSNSDFTTGAFAPEYGNALSGVFDLKLRRGNNHKREYTLQAGFLGLDAAMEGPFKPGYAGSYLVNYRYSTLSILGKVGVPLGDAITNFQDLSYHVYLPTANWGSFSLFGFGGLSYQNTQAHKDSLKWQEDPYYQYQSQFYSHTGAAGFSHLFLFKNQSNLKTALIFNGTQNGYEEEEMQYDYQSFKRTHAEDFAQKRQTLSSVYTQKLNARNNLRAGVNLNRLGFNLQEAYLVDSNNYWRTAIQNEGSTYSAQTYFQWNHRLNNKLSTHAGFHYLHFLLNHTYSLEPRAAIKFEINPRNTFTAGYGLHGQIQPLGTYFVMDQTGKYYNQQLKMSKAHHFVLGYDFQINSHTHVKTETYFQQLFQVPIAADPNSTFSMLNEIGGYPSEVLVNKGLGRNYGVEFTFERFLHRNFYYLLSASFYQSEYRAANLQWYNTRFNTNRAITLTLGKEWELKKKNRILGFNFKSVYNGGYRNTPVDLAASQEQGKTIFNNAQAYQLQNPDYFRLDIRISLKRNYNKLTSTLALDLQNSTNRKNVGGQYYDNQTGSIKYWYQTPLIPVLSYRLEF